LSTLWHPTAGFILDVAHGAAPGPLSGSERDTLRRLATQVAELAALPEQQAKRDLWYRHNALERTRPMLLVFPEDSWAEILDETHLELSDPFWRQYEWYLRHLLYRHDNLADDFVVERELYVPRQVRWGDWGLQPTYERRAEKGSYVWDAPLKEPADLAKLRYPTVEVDEAATQQAYAALGEVLGDILPVRIHCALPAANLVGEATMLRGIEQVMLDMHERPAFLHELMAFIAEGLMRGVRYLEEGGYLTLNNGHHYTDSGGIGYTRELPAPGFDGKHVRLRDLWCHGVAQELAWVGPVQHEEFVLRYQMRLLEQCGLVAYGCCESYQKKFAMLRRIPRLRRVSISPWCDVEAAAAQMESRYIYSWKPNPAMIVGCFDQDAIRAYIRHTLEVTRGCALEIVHKDTFTVECEPQRLTTWCRIAREEIEKM
jgi:hypothetical protein